MESSDLSEKVTENTRLFRKRLNEAGFTVAVSITFMLTCDILLYLKSHDTLGRPAYPYDFGVRYFVRFLHPLYTCTLNNDNCMP